MSTRRGSGSKGEKAKPSALSRNASILLAIDLPTPRRLDVRLVATGKKWDVTPHVLDRESRSLFVRCSQRTLDMDVFLRGYREAQDEDYQRDARQRQNIRDQLLALRTQGRLNPVAIAAVQQVQIAAPFKFDTASLGTFSWNTLGKALGTKGLADAVRKLPGCALGYLSEVEQARKLSQLLKRPPTEAKLSYYSDHRALLAPAFREYEAPAADSPWSHRWILPHMNHYPLWLGNPLLATWLVVTLMRDASVVADMVVDTFECAGARDYVPAWRAGDSMMPDVADSSLKELVASVFEGQFDALMDMRGASKRSHVDTKVRQLGKKIGQAKREALAVIASKLPSTFDSTRPIIEWNTRNAGGSISAGRYRAQAVEAAPALAHLVLDQSEAKVRSEGAVLIDAIDQAESLIQATAQQLSVPVWVARRLGQITKNGLGILREMGIDSTSARLRLIRTLGANGPSLSDDVLSKLRDVMEATFPERGAWEDWGHLERQYSGQIGGTDLFYLRIAIIGNSARKVGWDALELPNCSGDEFSDYLFFACDCLEASVAGLYSGHINHLHRKLGRALQRTFRDATMQDIARWSARFHAVAANLEIRSTPAEKADARKRAPGSTAASLVPPLTIVSGRWNVHQLLTEEELFTEGKEMQHCVRTYDDRVQSRSVAMFSLRAAKERLTVMVSRTPLGGWRILHSTGFHNAPVLPGTPAQEAVDALLDILEMNDPALEKALKDSYSAAASKRTHEHRSRRFVHKVVEGFGDSGWRFFRHCLPGSSHGRIETKLRGEFLLANRRVAAEITAARARDAEEPARDRIAALIFAQMRGLALYPRGV